jgi:hypothetical protein
VEARVAEAKAATEAAKEAAEAAAEPAPEPEPAPPAAQLAPPTATAEDTVWYETADGGQESAAVADLPALLASGTVSAESHVWMEGLSDWRPMREAQQQVEGLRATLLAADDAVKLAILERVWARADADGSGELDKGGLRSVLLQMGSAEADVDIDFVMAAIDLSGDGLVGKDDFAAWFFNQAATKPELLIAVHYETDGGGRARATLAELPGLLARGALMAD